MSGVVEVLERGATIEVVQQNQPIEVVELIQTVEVLEVGLPGPPGPPGPAGAAGGSIFTHTQATPLTTWTINHGLGRYPTTATYSPGAVEIEGAVMHTSLFQTLVLFNAPQAGFATCS